MLKLAIFICFIINPILLLADNWEPFPLNQKSYFKITEVKTPWLMNFEDEDLQNAITMIKFDSVFQEKNQESKYFSQVLSNSDNLLIEKKDSLKNRYDVLPNLIPESYIFKKDTIIFMINDEDKIQNNCLKIPLNLKINESYYQTNFDEIYKYTMNIIIKLISKEERNNFGIIDSVITFQIEKSRIPDKQDGTFIIEISKKFGFLKFMPLDVLYPWSLSADIQQLELVASTINSEQFGDTFDFQYRKRNYLEKSGDIKIFKHIWGDLGNREYVFICDSIIGVDDMGDARFIVYNHKTLSSSLLEYPDSNKIYQYSYLKKDSIIYNGYNAMVDAIKRGEMFIPSTKLIDKLPNNETDQTDDSLEVIATPLFFKFVEKCGEKDMQIFYNYQATLDRKNCQIQSRYFIYRILDKTTDLWWAHMISVKVFEGDHIVGYRNGDCEWGDISWPPKGVSVKEIKTKNTEIFPNPASDRLTLSNNPEGAVNYEIFDILGNRILSTPSLRDTPQEGNLEIDITKLSPGIYFIKIGTQKLMKFVKI